MCWLRLGTVLTFLPLGLGSVVVYATTLFALLMGVNSGLTAIVIVQAGIFAEASRQLVRYVLCQRKYRSTSQICLQGRCSA